MGENKLEFYNSLKMKMAVILGIIQMSGGLILSLMNSVYFKDMKHVWFGFIPEVTFLWCSFGYMCFMIIYKWNVNWPARFMETVPAMGEGHFFRAPSLLETQTNFFLGPGTVEAD